ncbi:Repetin [Streptomyces swartbergensis]|uniref:Repetin n=1 Tax=Streptomyces swartbergensis TaxID=487165 RepID=UPI0037F2FF55
MNRRTRTALLGSALLLTVAAAAGSAGASDESRREAAALTGKAKLYRTAGDDITFSFDAHLAARDKADPMKATGTFEWSHYLNGEGAWAKAKVDCLVTGGKVAVVSGVVTDTDLPGAKGTRVGITVHDLGRHDRLGYSWATTEDLGPKDLPKCVGSAPFEKVRKGTGGFTVVPWRPDF